ncbi:DUF2796 domain-containing protein [Pseudomonas auratipiscis]|uniref:DUF2796 domain-containing protein n=1 Tax=Pseudomonas auratipiscis TaxID=3115853 RepID=A0AB35WZZ1_9PSED|nr:MULTISPECIES: DUF2796 domain-containing protein [unclassified Pseudomonas]MEE1868872.1 DUF2796 domain-containing protein [Pseudomonas sp. 120P]MEE1959392.1 DUF2796 domain-containing protein [Pseudomonas sp. 119P]
MRRLFLALPFALLPLAVAQAHEDHDHDHDHAHGSLGAHEHGVARLNVALDGKSLELELESPAMNLVGFEHAASSDSDKAKVAAVRAQLEKPLALFTVDKAANCSEADRDLESPLFGDTPEAAKDHHDHSEIHAHYRFDCDKPEQLGKLDLSPLFKAFPATQKIQVQLIGPNGQQGIEATAANASIPL